MKKMENNTEEIKYVTSEDLTEHSKVVVEAVDALMVKHVKEIRSELYIVRDELKKEIKETRNELGTNINKLQTDVDWLVKKQEDSKDEKVILDSEIKQMKGVFKEKMGVEIRAV